MIRKSFLSLRVEPVALSQGPIPKNFIFVSYGHAVFGQGLVCWNNNLTKIEKSVFIIASVILEMEMIVNWAFETR